ncbi:hypothetical protein [Streptomyces sporangiiformans]|nr:hypothetical protein [Streptomyces sporangiiformans]
MGDKDRIAELAEQVDRWVPTASILHSNGAAKEASPQVLLS